MTDKRWIGPPTVEQVLDFNWSPLCVRPAPQNIGLNEREDWRRLAYDSPLRFMVPVVGRKFGVPQPTKHAPKYEIRTEDVCGDWFRIFWDDFWNGQCGTLQYRDRMVFFFTTQHRYYWHQQVMAFEPGAWVHTVINLYFEAVGVTQ